MARTKPSAGMDAGHPLDPLSETEVALASEILRKEKRLGPHARFTHVQLEEPAKSDVLGMEAGCRAAAAGRRHPVRLQDRRDACRDGRSRFEARDGVAGVFDQGPSLRPAADHDRGGVQGRRHRQGRRRLAACDEAARLERMRTSNWFRSIRSRPAISTARWRRAAGWSAPCPTGARISRTMATRTRSKAWSRWST